MHLHGHLLRRHHASIGFAAAAASEALPRVEGVAGAVGQPDRHLLGRPREPRLPRVLATGALGQLKVEGVRPPRCAWAAAQRRLRRRHRQPDRRRELVGELPGRPLAHGGVQLKLLRLRRSDGDEARRRADRALVEPVDDLRAPGDVAPPREQPHALARQHIAADAQRLVGKGAQPAVVAPLQQVADAARRVALEEEADGAVDVVVLEHEHRRAVHQRLLRKQRVRLREQHAAALGHRELVHPPRAVAAGAGRAAAAAAARRRRARRILLRHAVREARAEFAPVLGCGVLHWRRGRRGRRRRRWWRRERSYHGPRRRHRDGRALRRDEGAERENLPRHQKRWLGVASVGASSVEQRSSLHLPAGGVPIGGRTASSRR